MELNTEAIILSINKFKPNASILHLYTREQGRCALLLYGARSKAHGNEAAYLHPLSVVYINATIRNSRELNTIHELKSTENNLELLFNPVKSALAFFIAEILTQVLKTNEKDNTLFDFLCNSIRLLNDNKHNLGNFHILFLVQLSRFLGFRPNPSATPHYAFFDLQQGEYTTNLPTHNHILLPNEATQMQRLLRISPRNFFLFRFTKKEREDTLNKILEFYRIHTDGMREPKSWEVLKDVFN